MFEAVSSVCSAFGLSSATGLNTYIPLLVFSIMTKLGVMHPADSYKFIGEWWCIAILVTLCIVEIVVDKVPGADHINDIVMTFVRPTLGAVIFAAQAGTIEDVHPGVWLAAGLLTSGGVHGVKAVARPVINTLTLGIGAPIVSTIEDFVSTVLAILSVLIPILAVIFVIFAAWLLYRMFKSFVSGKRKVQVQAVTVTATPVPDSARQSGPWGGGV
jgi:hypothetical protein